MAVEAPTIVTNQTILTALRRLPTYALPDVLQFIEYLEYKLGIVFDEPSEDEALWDAVQAEVQYRQKHPEDVIVCQTIEELKAALGDEE